MGDDVVESVDSGSDSEKPFDMTQYEKKKYKYCKQVVLAENHYQQVRTMMRDIKREEVRKKKEALRNGTDPEWIRRKQEILDDAQRQRDESKALYLLEIEAHENQMEAMRMHARSQFDDARERARELLIETLEEEIAERIKQDRERAFAMAMMEATKPEKMLKITKEDSMKLFPERRKKAIVLQTDGFDV